MISDQCELLSTIRFAVPTATADIKLLTPEDVRLVGLSLIWVKHLLKAFRADGEAPLEFESLTIDWETDVQSTIGYHPYLILRYWH